MPNLTQTEYVEFIRGVRQSADTAHPDAIIAVPLAVRILADQLTPVAAYRRLVAEDERTAPSFLLESVEGGERQGRYSILGAHPSTEVIAFGRVVTVSDHTPTGSRTRTQRQADPVDFLRGLSAPLQLAVPPDHVDTGLLPACVHGGWFGYAGYDTVRYAEPEKLDARYAPEDDRTLPDMHFGFYDGVVVFDHVAKLVYVVQLARVSPTDEPAEAYLAATQAIEHTVEALQQPALALRTARMPRTDAAPEPLASNTSRDEYNAMIDRALEYIRAGDIFQVVLGQRFERRSAADPFDVYRALRAVNPSPYMVYMQAARSLLIASSPEILCRVRTNEDPVSGRSRSIVTNHPLAGTRPRGATRDEDVALENDLLADPKERAEHVMLVDLGRNDVGKVAVPGTVALSDVMSIERYSHVMHISSTVEGELRAGLDCWDALRAALPVGTISGAPKIRAMQIIDELEKARRGPYGGGIGWVGLDGAMDIALALRTMVVPLDLWQPGDATPWPYHIQAADGIVADSRVDAEFTETVNKAAALATAIDAAERAFGPVDPGGATGAD